MSAGETKLIRARPGLAAVAAAVVAASLSAAPNAGWAQAGPGAGASRPPPAPPPSAAALSPSPSAKTWTAENRSYARPHSSSKAHYEALKRQAGGGLTKPRWDQMPDWSGVWTAQNGVSFDPTVRPRDNKAYGPLTVAYQAQYEKTLADVAKGIEFDPLSYCLPAGYPRWLSEPFLREFVPTPEKVLLMNEMVNETRRVYTDGRDHPPEDESFPLWEGHSVGFWDGDVLVVHTNSLRDGDYHRSGPRYSDQATTVEQWRRIDPETIEVWITVYDPPALTKPWHVVRRFNRVNTPGARLDQWVCEENNNVVNQGGATQFVLPGESGYKDPNNFGKPPSAP